jgi:PEP-CTERM motif
VTDISLPMSDSTAESKSEPPSVLILATGLALVSTRYLWWRLRRRHLMLLVVTALIFSSQVACAGLVVTIDGFAINDNGGNDLNNAANVIDFNSLDMQKGFQNRVNSGYNVAGQVTANFANHTLTIGLIADRPVGAAGGQLTIGMSADGFGGGPVIQAFDSTNAHVSNGAGAAPYQTNAQTARAVPQGTDRLVSWQGSVNGTAIGNPVGPAVPLGNPAFPAMTAVSAPYPGDAMGRQVGHGPALFGDLGANFTLSAQLVITLGADRDQFSFFPAGGVSYTIIPPVPEPSTLTLASIGAGLIFLTHAVRLQKTARP